ncbi:MAG: sigma 54-interacting transcriptional regulator [Planctomycetes bacterium]|nr:sigma 54-interacting transcriptional regulator [Planctomycetota bacterium]
MDLSPGTILAQQYRVLERVGAGGTGAVYRVQPVAGDARGGEAIRTLALKDLDALRGSAKTVLDRARREFKLLGAHRHPHLAAVEDLVHDRETGRVCLVYEWLDGPDLSVEALEPLVGTLATATQERLLLDLVRQALSGLAYLHLHGLAHGDVSLPNLRFEAPLPNAGESRPPATRAGRKGGPTCSPESTPRLPFLRLLDFGLSRRTSPRARAHGSRPAQPAFRRDLRDLASAYRRLAAGLAGDRDIEHRFPRLSKLLGGLASPTTAGRIGSAQEAVARVDAWLAADGRQLRSPEARLPFVGRSRELARVAACFPGEPGVAGAEVAGRRPNLVRVEGEAGSGRSAFLEQARRRAVSAGLRVALVPGGRGWREALPPLRPFLEPLSRTRLSNAARRLLQSAGSAAGGEGLSSAQAAPLLAEALECASLAAPLLLVLEDFDLAADADRETLLAAVAQAGTSSARQAPPGARQRLLTLLADQPRGGSPPAPSGLLELRLSLPALSESEVRRLVRAALPAPHDSVTRWVFQRSAGHPGLAVESIRWVCEQSRAWGRPAVSAADVAELDRAAPPGGVADWHLRRARTLPPRAREALLYLCAAGRPVAGTELRALLAASASEFALLLDLLGARGFASESELGHRPAQPFLAGPLLGSLAPEERSPLFRRLHERLADAPDASFGLETRVVFRVRYALEAGLTAEVAAQALPAVDHLIAARAWDSAVSLATRAAAALQPSAFAAVRLDLGERRLRALALAGRTEEALRAARDFLDSGAAGLHRLRRSSLLQLYARLSGSAGAPRQAVEALREALSLLRPSDAAARAEVFDLLGYTLTLTGDAAGAERAIADGLACVPRDDRKRRGSLLNTRGVAAQQAGRYGDAARAYEEALAERHAARDFEGEADSRYNLAMTLLAMGDARAARRAVVAARRVYVRMRDEVAVGRCWLELARAYLEESDVASARAPLAEARAAHARCGHAGDAYLLETCAGFADLLAGDLEGALPRLEGARRAAESAGDALASATALSTLAAVRLEAGRPAAALADIAAAGALFRKAADRHGEATVARLRAQHALTVCAPDRTVAEATRAMDLAGAARIPRVLAEATLLLALGERGRSSPEKARAHMKSAVLIAEACGDPRVPLRCLAEDPAAFGGERALRGAELRARRLGLGDLEARLLLARSRFSRTARAAFRLVEGARRAAPSATGGWLAVDLALELGRLRARLGEPASALSHFDEVAKMIGELASRSSEGDRENVLSAPQLVALREEIRRAGDLLRRGGRTAGSREDTRLRGLFRVLEVTAELNSTRATAVVLKKIMEAVFSLTRCERGFLALRGETGALQFVATHNLEGGEVTNPRDRISSTICAQVLETGKPLIAANAQEDDALRQIVSVREERLASVLCIPFRVKERVLGVFYVDNRLRTAAFSEADVEVLEIFAHQAALAIENARLHDEKNQALRRADELARRIEKQLDLQARELDLARERLARIEEGPGVRDRVGRLLGRSAAMQDVYAAIERSSSGYQPVLILGETGTGKELIAREIHRLGPRASKRFVPVNCAALSQGLEESELFGHVKGAFTGALAQRKGLVESADGGTLFLDEIPAMTAALQAKFLRVLQDGVVRPVGSDDSRKVDFRVLAASNEKLDDAVHRGAFREDLYYRLKGEEIRVPPLRERREDILVLADHFLEEAATRSATPRRQLESGALGVLLEYSWPGNVRELEQAMHAAAGRGSGPITSGLLVDYLRISPQAAPASGAREDDLNLDAAHERLQRQSLREALRRTEGNRTRAARLLGVSAQWLYVMMKKFGID